MTPDPFVEAVEKVVAAGRAACEAIESAITALEITPASLWCR
jgi:hypothetical protein